MIIRDIPKKDKKDLIENVNNLKVSRYLASVPFPYKKKDAEWWIDRCIRNSKKKKRENYEFVIESKETGKVIGAIGISKVDTSNGTATAGYWLGEKY